MAADIDKLDVFLGRFVGDPGGRRAGRHGRDPRTLGHYKALAQGAATAPELAAHTQTDQRYIREWLSSPAAGGYVCYNAATDRFRLSAEQAFTLADETSPAPLPGAFHLALSSLNAVPRFSDVRSGAGMRLGRTWMFSTAVRNSSEPAMPGISWPRGFRRSRAWWTSSRCRCRLRQGRIHDTHGAGVSEISFTGFDYHAASIAAASDSARRAGLDHCSFRVAQAKDFAGGPYDFITVFDPLLLCTPCSRCTRGRPVSWRTFGARHACARW